ncbi:MAG: hypothetical protein A2Y40_05410 [Candidatus Margulisbacteria bacterium GWF2_35_9]|nr:MAG: hypothetical protein A2Y40_05410 [Candidatus Margulisbacteria bacterium GWF2_35_9]
MNDNELKELYVEHHKKNRVHDFIFGGKERYEHIVDLVRELELKEKSVLDLGCRDCALAEQYEHLINKNNYIGVDIDEESLKRAKKKGFTVVNSEINSYLRNSEKKFDLVIISEVLEHLAHPKKTIELILNVLNKNGHCIVSVPNAFRLKNRIKFLLGIQFEEDYTHLRSYNSRMLTDYFSSYQFTVQRKDYIISQFLWINKKLFANTLIMVFKKF